MQQHQDEEECSELEYDGPPPPGRIHTRRKRRPPGQHAGPSRLTSVVSASASAASSGLGLQLEATLSPLGPRGWKRPIAFANKPSSSKKSRRSIDIPPPSYVVIYQQHANITSPTKEPQPLMQPHLQFDGVHITSQPTHNGWDERGTGTMKKPRKEKGKGKAVALATQKFDSVVITSSAQPYGPGARRRRAIEDMVVDESEDE